MASVFISHSTQDRAFLEKTIISTLRSHGFETWYCKDDIHIADQWEQKIREGLNRSDSLIVAISKNSIASQWVHAEVHWALQRMRGKVIPILLDDSDPSALHLRLDAIQHVDYRFPSKAVDQMIIDALAGDGSLTEVIESTTAPHSTEDCSSADLSPERIVAPFGLHIDTLLDTSPYSQSFLGFSSHLRSKVTIELILREAIAKEAFDSLPLALRRFKMLRHPNILRVIDVFDSQLALVVLKHNLGDSTALDRILRHEGLPANESCALALRVADALEYAHTAGFIHGWLKPRSIFVDGTGNIQVDCFYELTLLRNQNPDDEPITLGTPTHTAPEMMHIVEGAPFPQSDIYSLASILFELLTGSRPNRQVDWTELERLVGIKGPKVARILEKALQGAFELRQSSLSEFARELQSATKKRGFLTTFLAKFRGRHPS